MGTAPKICITGNERSTTALKQRLERVFRQSNQNICEIRLDYLNLTPKEAFLFVMSLPEHWCLRTILTNRLQASGEVSGGRCQWNVKSWQSWWHDIIPLKKWYAIDLDWLLLDSITGESLSWPKEILQQTTIFSIHAHFDELEEILPFYRSSLEKYKGGAKIAVPVRGPHEAEKLWQLTESLPYTEIKAIVAMGAAGKPWRYSNLAGSHTYFAEKSGTQTASGQMVWPDVRQETLPENLYLLLSRDAQNSYGESQWNRFFQNRSLPNVYVNMACNDDLYQTKQDEATYREHALRFFARIGAKGISITQPYKNLFSPLSVDNSSSVNTLVQQENRQKSKQDNKQSNRLSNTYVAYSTDAEILNVLAPEMKSLVIFGSGGAARAIAERAQIRGLESLMLTRDASGKLSIPIEPFDVLVNTWPAEFLDNLFDPLQDWLQKIEARQKPKLFIDAQFAKPDNRVKDLCESTSIKYVSGKTWWEKQAKAQAKLWQLDTSIRLPTLPRSKSETQRAILIALFRKGPTHISYPAICEDTNVILQAVKKLGARVSQSPVLWIIEPISVWQKNIQVDVNENGTALRMLVALASQMPEGEISLDAATSLRQRDIFATIPESLFTQENSWPLRVKTAQPLPTSISVAKTSQFASGCMIACAGQNTSIHFQDAPRSFPYLEMTAVLLNQAGYEVHLEADGFTTAASSPQKLQEIWHMRVSVDASGFAFLAAAMDYLGIQHEEIDFGAQADQVFFLFLKQMKQEQVVRFSLRDHPDLAPPLWAAAILNNRKITVYDAEHLRLKESNRITSLVTLANKLGLQAEERKDGFTIDASRDITVPKQPLPTYGDHRIAMAIGLLQLLDEAVEPDNKDCVAKSFPYFWQTLAEIKGLAL